MDKTLTVIQPTQAPTPPELLRLAIEKGLDMAQLEKLMDMQERWEKKEAKKAFFEALSRFQAMVPVLKKNRTANINSQKGNYSYNFSDLGSITEQVKKPLRACGLSYRWEFSETGEKLKVTCLLSHKDGHIETTSMEAFKDDTGGKNNIQQKGSAHTYLERYTLIGALGLSTAEDDNDGKTATDKKKPAAAQPKHRPDPEDPDYLIQWEQTLKEIKTRHELQAVFLKNKRAVESDQAIQKLFKDKEASLKAAAKPTSLP
jgi:hypothetical protein